MESTTGNLQTQTITPEFIYIYIFSIYIIYDKETNGLIDL